MPVPHKGSSQCKGTKSGACETCLKNSLETSEGGREQWESRAEREWESCMPLLRKSSFTLSEMANYCQVLVRGWT